MKGTLPTANTACMQYTSTADVIRAAHLLTYLYSFWAPWVCCSSDTRPEVSGREGRSVVSAAGTEGQTEGMLAEATVLFFLRFCFTWKFP